jgi:hypothetical protein
MPVVHIAEAPGVAVYLTVGQLMEWSYEELKRYRREVQRKTIDGRRKLELANAIYNHHRHLTSGDVRVRADRQEQTVILREYPIENRRRITEVTDTRAVTTSRDGSVRYEQSRTRRQV